MTVKQDKYIQYLISNVEQKDVEQMLQEKICR